MCLKWQIYVLSARIDFVLAAFSEFERELIRERTKAACRPPGQIVNVRPKMMRKSNNYQLINMPMAQSTVPGCTSGRSCLSRRTLCRLKSCS